MIAENLNFRVQNVLQLKSIAELVMNVNNNLKEGEVMKNTIKKILNEYIQPYNELNLTGKIAFLNAIPKEYAKYIKEQCYVLCAK